MNQEPVLKQNLKVTQQSKLKVKPGNFREKSRSQRNRNPANKVEN